MSDEVTLDYVAKKAGVSRATASRALNDRPGVALDVRDRVRIVADSLNYRPNRAARNLAGGRTHVVGLVLGGLQLQTDAYATSLVQAIATAADSYDEGLMLLLASQEPGRAVQNLLRDGLVDGVLVSAVAVKERWVEELLDTDLAKVLIGTHPDRPETPSIDVENCESSAHMVGHLLDTGCSRVGIITGPLDRSDAQLRLAGYRLAHERRAMTVNETLITEGDFSQLAGYERGSELLDRNVDAVFASNDGMALGLLRAADSRGVACPEDICIAGFDGVSLTDPAGPQLSTIIQPFDELGMKAMDTLIQVLAKSEVSRQVLVDPKIHYGETTRPPRPS